MYFPLNIHIEPTFGCNNRCPFCFTQVLEKRDYDFMPLSVAERISLQLHDDSNIIKFSLRGEPLINPEIYDIVEVMREHNPNTVLLLYSNGKLLSPNIIDKLYEVGLNYIYVDCYNNTLNTYVNRFKSFDSVNLNETDWNMYTDSSIQENKLIFSPEITENQIRNHGGNLNYLKYPDKKLTEPMKKICLRPFRDVAIYYNGDIGLCCDDGGLDAKLGNILTDNLYDIWNSRKLNSIRRNLLMDKRTDLPCNRCDYID